ncbi:MAG: TetR family transcriptional regulator [Thermoleophilaceae bacterium]
MARRYQKGEDRREAILRATLALIGERGLDAVTHRSVAEAAGVPLAATTYYFESKEELLEQALMLAAREEAERIERLVSELAPLQASPEQWADALARTIAADLEQPGEQLALFELLLEAARRPALRKDVEQWREAFLRLAEIGLRSAGSEDPETEARIVFSMTSGLVLGQLANPQDDFEDEILRPTIEHLFSRLLAGVELGRVATTG